MDQPLLMGLDKRCRRCDSNIETLGTREWRTFPLAPVELVLNVGLGQRETRRTAVNHHTYSDSVRLAEGRDAKQLAKGASHDRAR